MGEKIKTIIEELVKQDTLTLNILFSVWARPHSSCQEKLIWDLPQKLGLWFFLNLFGIMQYCSVVEYEIFLDVMSW